MATRNVVLTDRQGQLIDTLVQSGKYQNASEVLREGLRLVEQREAQDAAKLAALRAAAELGMASIENSEAHTFESAPSLRGYLSEVANAAIAGTKRAE
jgi:antitoxin ParD1/3/4